MLIAFYLTWRHLIEQNLLVQKHSHCMNEYHSFENHFQHFFYICRFSVSLTELKMPAQLPLNRDVLLTISLIRHQNQMNLLNKFILCQEVGDDTCIEMDKELFYRLVFLAMLMRSKFLVCDVCPSIISKAGDIFLLAWFQ